MNPFAQLIAYSDPEERERQRRRDNEDRKTRAQRERVLEARAEANEARRAAALRSWQDPAARERMLAGIRKKAKDPEVRERKRLALVKARATPKYRAKMSALAKEKWAGNPDYVKAVTTAVTESNRRRRGEVRAKKEK